MEDGTILKYPSKNTILKYPSKNAISKYHSKNAILKLEEHYTVFSLFSSSGIPIVADSGFSSLKQQKKRK